MGKTVKILTVIFPSNYPNFAADSIFAFNRILFSSLIESNAKVEVIAVGSSNMPEIHEKVRIIRLDLGVSKFSVRFNFPWDEMRHILNDVRPDICLINMPEQSAAFALLIKEELHLNCKLISYVHYIPALPVQEISEITYEASMNENGLCKIVLMRLLEGMIASDLTLIGSQFAVNLIRKVGKALLHDALDINPIQILPPPVDFKEVNIEQKQDVSEPFSFVYNHRLYDDYGTKSLFFNLLTDIYEMDIKPFTIIVTNPTEGRDPARSRLNPAVEENLAAIKSLPFVTVQHFQNRSEYMLCLKSSRAGLAPLKSHALWSMSVMDVLACGRPVLAFDIAAFSEMGLDKNLLAKDDLEFKNAFCSLLSRKDDDYLEREQQHYSSIAKQFSGTSIARRFMELIQAL